MGTKYGKIYVYYWYNGKVRSKNFPAGTTDEEINSAWDNQTGSGGNYTVFYAPDGRVLNSDPKNADLKLKYEQTYYEYTTNETQKSALGDYLTNGTYSLASISSTCQGDNAYFSLRMMDNGNISNRAAFQSMGTNITNANFGRAVILY